MTKRTVTEETTAVATLEPSAIEPISALTPAAVIGVTAKMEIAQSLLPQEFQGQELETLDSSFAPTVKWVTPGNFVGGVYQGYKEAVGPNSSRLYELEAGGQVFGIWGTTSLDTLMDEAFKRGQIVQGSKMLVIFMGAVETEKQPCKQFQIKVLKPK